MPGFSFVSLLAYDYRFLFRSLSSYYALADEIVLGLDRDRLTWTKQPFQIDMDEVRAFVDKIDIRKKIRIAEGDFHSAPYTILNDTNERCQLARTCMTGNWIVQIDADEMVQNGEEFRTWLLAKNPHGRVVTATWLTVFKAFDDQLLVVEPATEWVPVATMTRGHYSRSRMTAQPRILSPLQLLHFSWGRTPEEVMQKLNNWSHHSEFDARKFFDLWQSVTLENYKTIKDFHPVLAPRWQSLKLVTLQPPRD